MEPSAIVDSGIVVGSNDAQSEGLAVHAEAEEAPSPLHPASAGTKSCNGDGDVFRVAREPESGDDSRKLDAPEASAAGVAMTCGDVPPEAAAQPNVDIGVGIQSSPQVPGQHFSMLINLMGDKKLEDRELLDAVFNTLVGGSFDVETNFIIPDAERLLQLQRLVETCPEKLQAEIWSMLNGLLRKSRLNQLICTEAQFTEYILNRLQMPATSNLVADLLLEMLTILAGYSFTVKELQLLLSYLRVSSPTPLPSDLAGGSAGRGRWPPHALQVLQALRHMPHRHGCDEYFCFPGIDGAAISLPPIAGARWPYLNGWTFSTWVYLDEAPIANDDPATPYLYCFQSKQEVGYTANIVGSSLVVTCSRAKGKAQQHRVQYDFQPRQWYMITITHVYNRWKACLVKCYINTESVSASELPWAFTLPEQFDRCFIGGCASLDRRGAFCGQMAAVYLFNEAIQPNVIEALYAIGPSYKGQFKFESECGANVEGRHKKALFDGKLTASIMLMYSPTACHSNICLESSPKGNATVFAQAPHAMMVGGVKAVITRSIHTALHSLGGIQVIYPLFGQLDIAIPSGAVNGGAEFPYHKGSEICCMLMGLVCDLVETSTTVQQQMALSRGFLVIGHYLEKADPGHLSEDVLGCFIRLAKFFTSPAATDAPHCDTLLKQLNDYIFFNPALWINAPVKVQMVMYHFLAFQYLELAPLFGSPARRVSAVIQIFNAFKFYYYLVNPLDKSGFVPEVAGHARPRAEDLVKLRGIMLFFVDNLIGRYGGVIDDELESVLNYLTVINEVDNVYDVLCMCVAFMDKYAASMVPAFDRKHGMNTLFKLLASPSEPVRVQALKLLALFLARSTARRKNDTMVIHNLFSLLNDHLLLHAKFISHTIYACLIEVLTEKVSLQPVAPVDSRRPLDLSCRIENPAILKVISSLIKHSTPNQEVLEVRQLFLGDLLSLCENSPENRRCILQMSVWQDWLFSLAYIYPSDPVQEAVTADVLSVFRLLLFHAIRIEYGGWRVWIDTMAIVHARVSHEDFQIHVARLHHQQIQQAVSHENTDSGKQQTLLPADGQSARVSPAGSTNGSASATITTTAAAVSATKAASDEEGIEVGAGTYDNAVGSPDAASSNHQPVAAAAPQHAAASAVQKQRVTFSAAAPRSAPFRIPEFQWSHLHQYLLSDLLLTLDQDISTWTDKRDKTALMAILNDSENAVYVMNTVNIISHLSDVVITAAGGLLPLLSAATSATGHIDMLEPGYGLTIQNAVAYLLRVLQLSDVMVMSSSIPLRELETEKSMNHGTILRQCLRLVSTAVVRNCLECRRASGYYNAAAASGGSRRSSAAAAVTTTSQGTTAQPATATVASAAQPATSASAAAATAPAHSLRHPDPILALIEGARTRIGEHEEEPERAVADLLKLFQDADLTRLKAVLYRDTEDAKQTEWLVLATVYFMSVLMVSKYRDLLDPPGHTATATSTKQQATETVTGVTSAVEAAASRLGAGEVTHERQPASGQLPYKAWHREPEGSVTVRNTYSDSDDDDPSASLGTSLSVSVDVHSPASVRALPPSQPSSPSASSSSSTSDEACDSSSDAALATASEAVGEDATLETTTAVLDDSSDQLHSLSQADGLPLTMVTAEDANVAREEISTAERRDEGTLRPPPARIEPTVGSLQGSATPVVDAVPGSPANYLSSDLAPLSSEQGSPTVLESFEASSSTQPSGSSQSYTSAATPSSNAMSNSQELSDPADTPLTTSSVASASETTASSAEGRSQHTSTSATSSELRSQNDDTTKSISSIWLRTPAQSREDVEAPVRDSRGKQSKEEGPADFNGDLPSLAELPATAFAKRPSTDVTNLSERLEKALGTAAPVLKDILLEFSSFLSKRLIGSKGQELLSAAGLTAVRESQSAIELVMLLCSQEWQLSLQKHAGLAFIELVNEGRLLSHATRNHVVRVANEAEFILNKLRAEDVQKHAAFAALCAQNTHHLKQEDKTCDHLISSVKHRDRVMAVKIITKANAIYWCSHAFGDERSDKVQKFWKLDAWEDDSRRRRRLVPNVVGSAHAEATLRAALEQGATEEAVAEARENVLAFIASQKRHLGTAAASILPKQESLDGSFHSQDSPLADTPDSNVGDPENSAESAAEPVVFSTSCKLVCLGIDIIGTLSISRSELFFEVDDDNKHNTKLDSKVLAYAEHLHGRWSFSDIYAIFGRKYLLQNTAVEVFLSNRSSVMFTFPTQKIVKQVVSLLPRVGIGSKYGLPHTRQVSLASPMQLFRMSDMMQKWRRREISNFDYLMFLNTVAGRTYCDINQYPIFPWVLVNYDSDDIDLNQASNYRDLSKPVGALNPDRRAYFDERYASWGHTSDVPPFHYGTHYSTAALVLGWLLRVEPYATMYLSLQGGKFDYPNRTFSSVLGAWKSCQSDTADVKELVPEFYSLPEMFINSNRFKMGKLDDDTPVDDVLLPPWAENADDFVRICRQALESEIVSCQLHEWIDLIFGYKQRGPEAIRATNVFYYLSYEGGIDLEGIKDTALREAIESQIRFFGQTPAQLLLDPHPPRGSIMHLNPRMFAPARAEVCMILKFLTNSAAVHLSANTYSHISNPAVVSIFQNHTFAANKWTAGGSPTTPTTAEASSSSRPEASAKDKDGATVLLPLGLDPVLLTPNSHLRRNLGDNFDERIQLQRQHFTVTTDNRSLLACGFWDSSFRVFSVDTGKVSQVIFGHFDIVTCLSHSEVNTYHDCYVVTGSRDCTCMVWQWSGTQQRIINSDPTVQVSNTNLVPMSTLNGHLSEVVCCLVTSELGFVVSASTGGACLMHSLGGELLRSLEHDQGGGVPSLPMSLGSELSHVPPQALLVNREGFILALYGRAELCLFSLSGRFLLRRVFSDTIKCLTMSSDGQYVLTGGENGVLGVLRTHDLAVLYAYASCNTPIHDVAISHDQRYVMAGLGTGSIVVYNIDFTRWQHDYQQQQRYKQ